MTSLSSLNLVINDSPLVPINRDSPLCGVLKRSPSLLPISLWDLCGLESPQGSGERSLYRSAVVEGYKLTNFRAAVFSNIV
jgi:hypothetical protein